MADGVSIEVGMTLPGTSDVAHERGGVGQGLLHQALARVFFLDWAHLSIINHPSVVECRRIRRPIASFAIRDIASTFRNVSTKPDQAQGAT